MKASPALVALVLLSLSCAERGVGARTTSSTPTAAAPSLDPRDNVVIVTLDGVRWQEIFDGTEPARSKTSKVPASQLMPNLYAFGTERGAFIGAPGHGEIRASGPNFVSLPGYTELMSGRVKHPCGDNDCTRTTSPTFLDEARSRGAKVAAFAAWTKLDFALTSAPGAFPVAAGPQPGPAEESHDLDAQRSDYDTANAALAYYEAERPAVFFLGLGEPDEHAHYDNYAGYIAAMKHGDDVLGRLRAILDHDDRGRRTHVFITADHGRSKTFTNHGKDAPESARIWMVASGPSITARGFVDSKAPRHLADVTATARSLMHLEAMNDPRYGVVLDELF